MSVLESPQTERRTPRALAAMTRTETRLFFREPLVPALVLLLPVLLVVGFGLIPGFGDPSSDLSGQSGTEYIASIGVGIVLAVLGLPILPTTLGTYRERGVLRRLRATPVTPGTLLGAGPWPPLSSRRGRSAGSERVTTPNESDELVPPGPVRRARPGGPATPGQRAGRAHPAGALGLDPALRPVRRDRRRHRAHPGRP